MRSPSFVVAVLALAFSVAGGVAMLGCGPAVVADAGAVADLERAPARAPARVHACVVDVGVDVGADVGVGVAAGARVSGLVANETGVVFAVDDGDAGLMVQRASGVGCALEVEGAPVAAASLLDADDRGNVYVFPAQATSRGVVSTMLPGAYAQSMVVKVDAADEATKVVEAGRGIWDFGVSPLGDAMWMTACGPTGIFAMDEDELTLSMTPPDTLWQQMHSVLTDAHTFWSVGTRTCSPTAPLTGDCGFALVRATPDDVDEVGPTLVEYGAGLEQAALSRCGANVCEVFASAVVMRDEAGAAVATFTRDDVGAAPGERIATASGNRHGLYVLLDADQGSRVTFVPLE